MIKISVIIPIYNMERYLSYCLKSVLYQTLLDIEIICVDDASEDSSPNIINKYKQKDPRIISISLKHNSGAGIARNIGIKIAKGEYVAFLDPDDFYPKNNVLEKLYSKARKYKVKICGGSLIEFNGNNSKKNFQGYSKGFIFYKNKKMLYKKYQFEYGYVRFIYDRKFLIENKIYFPGYRRFQDPPFFVKAMSIAQKFYAISDATYCYRTGHKEIKWDQANILDFSKGVLDLLEMTYQYSLAKLRKNIVDQLNDVYFLRLNDNIKNNYKLLEIMLKIDSMIDLKLKNRYRKYNDDIFGIKVLNNYVREIKKECNIKRNKHIRISYIINMIVKVLKYENLQGISNALNKIIKRRRKRCTTNY